MAKGVWDYETRLKLRRYVASRMYKAHLLDTMHMTNKSLSSLRLDVRFIIGYVKYKKSVLALSQKYGISKHTGYLIIKKWNWKKVRGEIPIFKVGSYFKVVTPKPLQGKKSCVYCARRKTPRDWWIRDGSKTTAVETVIDGKRVVTHTKVTTYTPSICSQCKQTIFDYPPETMKLALQRPPDDNNFPGFDNTEIIHFEEDANG